MKVRKIRQKTTKQRGDEIKKAKKILVDPKAKLNDRVTAYLKKIGRFDV